MMTLVLGAVSLMLFLMGYRNGLYPESCPEASGRDRDAYIVEEDDDSP